MLTGLILLALAQERVVGPAPPAGSSKAFQEVVMDVELALSRSDFEAAENALVALPDKAVTIGWDPSPLPEVRRESLRAGIEYAIREWEKSVPEMTVEFASDPEVMISFVEQLPPDPATGLPQAAVFFESTAPAEPRVEAVLAMTRDESSVSAMDVANEAGFAIARALGVAERPGHGTYATRDDRSYSRYYGVGILERQILDINLKVAEALREAVAKRTVLEPALAEAFVSPLEFDVGTIPQGELRTFEVQITNRGNVPLYVGLQPDCSCMSIRAPSEVLPGQTSVAFIDMDTSFVPGDLVKKVFVYTNDHERPSRVIELTGRVTPFYEWIEPFEGSTVVVENGSEVARLFLRTDPNRDLDITKLSTSGPVESAIYRPFSGEVETGDGQRVRIEDGYEVILMLKQTGVAGRSSVGVLVETNNDAFSLIDHSFFVQDGITALPGRLFFGEIEDRATEAKFFLTRPGEPFEITGLEVADSKHFAVEHYNRRGGWEHGVVVRYLGGLPFGPFRTTVVIRTDSPERPRIEVPIEGTIG